eukprot:23201_1
MSIITVIIVQFLFFENSNADDLQFEISGQITTAQGLCINTPNAFPTEFSTLGNAVSSLSTKTTSNGNTANAIEQALDEEGSVIQASSDEIQALQQDILDVTNGIKSILENVKSTLETFITDLGQLLPVIPAQIAQFDNNVASKSSALENVLTIRVSDSTTAINNGFSALIPGKLTTAFSDLTSEVNAEFTTHYQIPAVVLSLNTFETNIIAEFGEHEIDLEEKFRESTNSINTKFGTPTGNIDQQPEPGTVANDVAEKFDLLDEGVEDLRKGIVSFLVSIRETVKSSQNILKWSIRLEIGRNFGFSAQQSGQEINIDGPSFEDDIKGIDDNFNTLLIELEERDLYIIGIGIIVINLIWTSMVIYIMVDYLNAKKAGNKFKTMS